jgi:transcriptional regulator of acetoin/glycerol metabolism
MIKSTNLIIEDLETSEKTSVGSMSGMTIHDAAKAIEIYDRMRLYRNEPRKARYADSHEDLSRSFRLGRISRTTYYRRLKQLGISPRPPKGLFDQD